MRVLYLSSTDLVGGRFNGFYMNRAVDPLIHQFEMAVWNKNSDSNYVYSLRPNKRRKILYFLNKLNTKISIKFGLEGLTGLGSYLLTIKPYFQSADILHLHLIHNEEYFNILDLPRLTRLKPTVWTIHDFWALSDMCIYPFDCEAYLSGCCQTCPYPRGNSPFRHTNPRVHWKLKNWAYHQSKLNIVVASKWMQSRVEKSPLLSRFPIVHIPFGIDLMQFQPRNKSQVREKLNIPVGNHVIAFRAASEKWGYYSYLYKGVQWLKDALEKFQPLRDTTLLIFQDEREFIHLNGKYQIINLPWADGDTLVDALSSADVFMMPSIQETFGMMAIESMACGVPVIVFDGTSLPEVIQEPLGGLVVPSKDSNAMVKALNRLLSDEEFRLAIGRSARELVETQYSFIKYVQRHLDLYSSILDSKN